MVCSAATAGGTASPTADVATTFPLLPSLVALATASGCRHGVQSREAPGASDL